MKTFDEFLQQEIEKEGKRNLPHLIHSLGANSKKLPKIFERAADEYANQAVKRYRILYGIIEE